MRARRKVERDCGRGEALTIQPYRPTRHLSYRPHLHTQIRLARPRRVADLGCFEWVANARQRCTRGSAETVIVTRVDSDLTPSVNKSEEICTRACSLYIYISLALPVYLFQRETNYRNNVCVRYLGKVRHGENAAVLRQSDTDKSNAGQNAVLRALWSANKFFYWNN